MSDNKAKLPIPKLRLTGVVLNPGDEGYDEALARLKARQAEEAQAQQQKTKETTT